MKNTVTSPILVVGGSGGIGLAFVRQFLDDDRQNQVIATYRRPSPALQDLQTQYPERLQTLALDITDEAQIGQMVTTIQGIGKELQIVVNAVGWLQEDQFSPEKSLRHLNAEQLQRYFAVNTIGPALLTKHLLPFFRHRQRSIFAHLSAKVGSITDNKLGGWYGYRASKAALNMLIKTAAIEYQRAAPQAILVCLHPGTTDTELSKPFQRSVPPEKLFSTDRTVSQLLAIMEQLTPQDSGSFYSCDGSRIPW